jgi:hypothetical protein
MDSFLRTNGVDIVLPLVSKLNIPEGSIVYVPDNVAVNFLADHLAIPLDFVLESPDFLIMLQYGVNPSGFPIGSEEGKETIDTLAVLASKRIGRNTYKVIDGVLGKGNDLDILKRSFLGQVKTRERFVREEKHVKPGVKVQPQPPAPAAVAKKTRKTPEPKIPKAQVRMTDEHIQSISALGSAGSGIANTGEWRDIAPRKGAERTALKAKCGNGCFLRPEDNAYPICSRLGIGADCAVQCTGLSAANSRSVYLPDEYRGPNGHIQNIQRQKGCRK